MHDWTVKTVTPRTATEQARKIELSVTADNIRDAIETAELFAPDGIAYSVDAKNERRIK